MKVCQKKNPLDTKTGHAVHSTLLPFFVALSEQVVPHSFFLFYKFRCHLLLQQTHLFLPVINAITFLSSTHNFPNKASLAKISYTNTERG